MHHSAVVAAFYKFVEFPDFAERRKECKALMLAHGLRGTILLAPEGINATVSGAREGVDALLSWLKRDPRFADLAHKESFCAGHPFKRAKVRLKKEIIAFGLPADHAACAGTYVRAEDWNRLIADPGMLLLDTRNAYETAFGAFRGAMTFDIRNFKQLPERVRRSLDQAKHKKIAMYCTGGIRCEKFAAHMLGRGFEEVYQLEGGILKYLETVPEKDSLWEGGCFVFDGRVTIGHGLTPSANDTDPAS